MLVKALVLRGDHRARKPAADGLGRVAAAAGGGQLHVEQALGAEAADREAVELRPDLHAAIGQRRIQREAEAAFDLRALRLGNVVAEHAHELGRGRILQGGIDDETVGGEVSAPRQRHAVGALAEPQRAVEAVGAGAARLQVRTRQGQRLAAERAQMQAARRAVRLETAIAARAQLPPARARVDAAAVDQRGGQRMRGDADERRNTQLALPRTDLHHVPPFAGRGRQRTQRDD